MDGSIDRPAKGTGARFFNAYRLAAYVLVLYGLGHTTGAVVGTPRFGTESDAVVTAMKTVHVAAQGADCTWYGFFRGFGAFISVFMAFSAVMAWRLGGMTRDERAPFALVVWALVASYAASAVTSWVYLSPMPVVFSTAVTALLAVACAGDARSRAALASCHPHPST
jgi:hypothetical protein